MAADRHHQCRPLFRDRSPRGCSARPTCPHQLSSKRPHQSVDAKIKTFNRLHGYLARLEALDSGADDAIMLDLEGYVTEGRGANVFIVRDGQLFTPPEGLLEGITRETVFELAVQEGLPAREGDSPRTTSTMPTKSSTARPLAASCRLWRSTADRSGAAYQARSRTNSAPPTGQLTSAGRTRPPSPHTRRSRRYRHRISFEPAAVQREKSRSTEFMQTIERVMPRIASAN